MENIKDLPIENTEVTASKSAKELLSNLSFCVFDLETTGGNHTIDKIIEIGLVKIENLKVTGEKSYLIRPEMKVPDFIQKLTAITAKDLEKAPIIDDVIEEILKFMGDSILVAHNISFDIPFFNSVLKRLNLPQLGNNGLCTNLMTKYLIPNLLNTNLNYMSKIFDIKHKKAHRALDDARASAELLLCYLNIFIAKEINKVNQLYYPRNRFELDRTNFKKGTPISTISSKLVDIRCPFLINVKGKEGIILLSYPVANPKLEVKKVLAAIEKIPFENITINLYGSFFESLVHFSNSFPKMGNRDREEVLQWLWELHLPNIKPKIKMASLSMNDNNNQFSKQEVGDFVITPHLVPEQFIIFPVTALHPKQQLIFRYPGHQKKLIQFISSKSSRISNNKLKKIIIAPQLQEFIVQYLLTNKDNSKDVFIFEKDILKKSQEQFLGQLEDFMKRNEVGLNYPKEYV